MGKKKSKQSEKQTTVNNIQQLNLEIDYDKLAEAIVRAKGVSKEKEEEKIKNARISLLSKLVIALFAVLSIASFGCSIYLYGCNENIIGTKMVFMALFGVIYAVCYSETARRKDINFSLNMFSLTYAIFSSMLTILFAGV